MSKKHLENFIHFVKLLRFVCFYKQCIFYMQIMQFYKVCSFMVIFAVFCFFVFVYLFNFRAQKALVQTRYQVWMRMVGRLWQSGKVGIDRKNGGNDALWMTPAKIFTIDLHMLLKNLRKYISKSVKQNSKLRTDTNPKTNKIFLLDG